MESASTSSTKEDETSTMTIEKIGAVLLSTPPIVEHILQNISSIRHLNQCAKVCRLWRDVAQAIKKGRTDIIRMFMVHKDGNYDDHLNMISCSSREICVAKCRFDIGEHFYEIINRATSEPKLALLFASGRMFDKPKRFFKDFKECPDPRTKFGKRRRRDESTAFTSDDQALYYCVPLIDFLKVYLPRKCQIIGCGTLGIVGTPIDNSAPLEVESSHGMTAVFLPSLPGVEVYQFKIFATHEEVFRRGKQIGRTLINNVTGIPENKQVKCLLTFFHDVPEHVVSAQVLIQHYLQEENYKMALGGAVVDELAVPLTAPYDEGPMCVGIAFTGEDVKAASIILEQNLKSKEEILAKLKKLKDCNIPEENMIAFMFACCGRGSFFYGESNVEADMFHKVFPKTPLIGMFGGGEIGIEFLPNFGKENKRLLPLEDSQTSKTYKWFHEYTTIIVLLHLGKSSKE